MVVALLRQRKFYAGVLLVLVGLFGATLGSTYGVGTLRQMGPGFFPTALGIIMVLLGTVISITPYHGENLPPVLPDWRGWWCILGGVIAFLVLGNYFGLLPATFFSVFISAMGDRTATWKGSLLLAFCITVFGVTLFAYILGVQFPVLHWL